MDGGVFCGGGGERGRVCVVKGVRVCWRGEKLGMAY